MNVSRKDCWGVAEKPDHTASKVAERVGLAPLDGWPPLMYHGNAIGAAQRRLCTKAAPFRSQVAELVSLARLDGCAARRAAALGPAAAAALGGMLLPRRLLRLHARLCVGCGGKAAVSYAAAAATQQHAVERWSAQMQASSFCVSED